MSLQKDEWRFELDPTLEAIEEVCANFRVWRAQTCADLEQFPAELLLREALTNSVAHGCPKGSSARIRVVLRAKQRRLFIAVQDEGEGFDWRAAWNKRADASDTHGRGVEIFRQYANSVRFNPKGNSVILIKRF
jgi:anti-sigma regulatory factor (Ser/Thr protein kinase)